MTGLHPHLLLAGAVQPYVNTRPVALLLWLVINLISFAFEFNQWIVRREEADKTDRGSLAVLLSCSAAGLIVLGLAPSVVPTAAIRPGSFAFAFGLVMYLAGFAMRRWSEMALGRYFTFTVMTSADQPVITTGPYRIVRHPGYTGVLLVVVGAGFVAGNWIGLLGFTVSVLFPLLYRIRVEETALLGALGDRYRSYAAAHKRLVPLVW